MCEEYIKLVAECANEGRVLANKLANAGIFTALYLYGRKSIGDGKPGQLILISDYSPPPPDFELVTGEGLRGNVEYQAYFQWVYDRAGRFPLMAWTA